MSNSLIEIDPIPANTPSHFLRNGRLFLEGEIPVRFSKSISELTQLKKIKTEAALGTSAPKSKVNDFVFSPFINPNDREEDDRPINVSVWTDSKRHRLDNLFFTGENEASGNYDFEVRRSSTHWVEAARDTFLNDVDLGTFAMTQSNLQNSWSVNSYVDGATGVYFPLAHYGNFGGTVKVSNFRPWLHALFVLQRGFCHIGWDFRCPFLETSTGRKIITYILKEDYGGGTGEATDKNFSAQTTTLNPLVPKIIFETESFDNSNDYDHTTGDFTGTGIFDFNANISVSINSYREGQGTNAVTVRIVKSDGVNRSTIASDAGNWDVEQGGFFFFELEAQGIEVAAGESVFVEVNAPGGDVVRITGIFFNNFLGNNFTEAATITLKDQIHPDYTLLDYFKGIADLLAGKVYLDWNNRRVWLFSPYSANVFGENIEGFYLDEVEEITEFIHANSRQVVNKKTTQKRFVKIQFADSNDQYIEGLNLDNPIFSKTVDLGEQYENDEVTLKNPFFEPTANALRNDIPKPLIVVNGYPVDVPILWDNTDKKTSTKIGPRIAIAGGLIDQVDDDGNTTNWSFENTARQAVPYAYQLANRKIAGSPPTEIAERLIYGEDPNDLYTMFYGQELFDQLIGTEYTFARDMNVHQYEDEDFRRVKELFYDGRMSLFRVKSIGDFDGSENQSNITVVPLSVASAFCDKTSTAEACVNNPGIQVQPDFDNNQVAAIAADGDFSGTIDTDIWEYSIDGGSNWLTYTPGDDISATVITFRRIVTYIEDSCSDSIVLASYNQSTQCNNSAQILDTYDGSTNTAFANGAESFNSPVDTETWTFIKDSDPELPYIPGTNITGFLNLTFKRAITFTNGCGAINIEKTITVVPPQCNNQPTLILSEIEAGSKRYNIEIGGSTTSDIHMTIVKISYDNGLTWKTWDNKPVIKTPNMKIRALVHYCDSCATTCLEEICE